MTKKTTAAAKAQATAAVDPATTTDTDASGTIDASQIEVTGITAGSIAVGTIAVNVLIPPSVGRKVWYRPGPQDRHSHMQWIEGQPLDATILAVHDDRTINALVLDINGTPFTRRNWPLVQHGDLIPDGSYFEWMPYQTGQAAKAA